MDAALALGYLSRRRRRTIGLLQAPSASAERRRRPLAPLPARAEAREASNADPPNPPMLCDRPLARRRRATRARAASAGRGWTSRNNRYPARQEPYYLRCPAIRRRRDAAGGGLYRSPLCGYAGARCPAGRRSRQGRFQSGLCLAIHRDDRCRRTGYVAGWCHGGLLRAIRQGRHPQHRRAQGQDRRGAGARLDPARTADCPGGASRARPGQGHSLGDRPQRQTNRTVCAGPDRCVPRLPAGATGSAYPAYRSRARQHRNGPAVVAVLLLPVGGQSRVRSQIPDGDEARLARGFESCRPLCRRSGRSRTTAGRWPLHPSLR